MRVAWIPGEAEGAIPNGTRVRKTREDPEGDITPIGTQGVVLASHRVDIDGVTYAYFVEWDTTPGVPIGCGDWKIERVDN